MGRRSGKPYFTVPALGQALLSYRRLRRRIAAQPLHLKSGASQAGDSLMTNDLSKARIIRSLPSRSPIFDRNAPLRPCLSLLIPALCSNLARHAFLIT